MEIIKVFVKCDSIVDYKILQNNKFKLNYNTHSFEYCCGYRSFWPK